MSAISSLIKGFKEVDRRLEEEENRHRNIVKRYENKLDELQRLSHILKGEIPESETTDNETPWIYLYKNNFVDAVERALRDPESK